jgi:hypothetical protein
MCSLCSVLVSEHWAEAGTGRRTQLLRLGLLNRVLGQFGLRLDGWSGRDYVLRDRVGSTAVVSDLGSLWAEAERLVGRPLDPLDADLVAALG